MANNNTPVTGSTKDKNIQAAENLRRPATSPLKGGAETKYNVDSYTYPLDLGSAEYPHTVTFFINVRERSASNKKDSRVSDVEVPTTGENRLNAQQAQGAVKATAVVGGAAVGVGVGKATAAGVGKVGGSKIAGAAAGTVAGAGTGVVAKKVLENTGRAQSSYRLKDCITLHVSDKPSSQYKANWAEKELGLLGAMAQIGSFSDALQKGGPAAERLARQFASLPKMLGAASPADLYAASSKKVENPYKEQLFRDMDFRTFGFEYKFLPRSRTEANNVRAIIAKFKEHMHPELVDGGLFMLFPSEFNIVYYYNGQENQNVHKIGTCVLTSLSVDYGGDLFQSFDDGMPVEVNVKLQFLELEMLTRERINEGY